MNGMKILWQSFESSADSIAHFYANAECMQCMSPHASSHRNFIKIHFWLQSIVSCGVIAFAAITPQINAWFGHEGSPKLEMKIVFARKAGLNKRKCKFDLRCGTIRWYLFASFRNTFCVPFLHPLQFYTQTIFLIYWLCVCACSAGTAASTHDFSRVSISISPCTIIVTPK